METFSGNHQTQPKATNGNITQPTKPNRTKLTRPNLIYPTYQIQSTKHTITNLPNLPNQTDQNKTNQTFPIKCTYFINISPIHYFRFISVANSLPKTSYVKMVDVWLIFNLIIPFVEVHTDNKTVDRYIMLLLCRFCCKLILSIYEAK